MNGALCLAGAALVDLWERFDVDGRAVLLGVLRGSPDRDLKELATVLEDPLLRAVARAPVGPPLSAEVRAGVDAAERSIAAGERGKSQEEIEALLEELRRNQIEIDDLSALGKALVSFREMSGLDQRQLAARLCVHESQVSRDEGRDYDSTTVARAARVLEALGVRFHACLTLRGAPTERAPHEGEPLTAERLGRPIRVLVCGSRGWREVPPIRKALAKIPPGSVVLHGGARGADTIAERVAREMGFDITVFEANWRKYGHAAGPRRNERMLCEGRPDRVLAFNLGTPGTNDMIAQAKRAGIPTLEHTPERSAGRHAAPRPLR